MTERYVNPFPRMLTDNIKSVPGGKLEFFQPGAATTQKVVYKDRGRVTEHTNPVVLDAFGNVPEIWLDGTYFLEYRAAPTVPGEDGVLLDSTDLLGGTTTTAPLDDYNETISYDTGDLVTASDGCNYRSKIDGNLNNDPANEANPDEWEKVQFIAGASRSAVSIFMYNNFGSFN